MNNIGQPANQPYSNYNPNYQPPAQQPAAKADYNPDMDSLIFNYRDTSNSKIIQIRLDNIKDVKHLKKEQVEGLVKTYLEAKTKGPLTDDSKQKVKQTIFNKIINDLNKNAKERNPYTNQPGATIGGKAYISFEEREIMHGGTVEKPQAPPATSVPAQRQAAPMPAPQQGQRQFAQPMQPPVSQAQAVKTSSIANEPMMYTFVYKGFQFNLFNVSMSLTEGQKAVLLGCIADAQKNNQLGQAKMMTDGRIVIDKEAGEVFETIKKTLGFKNDDAAISMKFPRQKPKVQPGEASPAQTAEFLTAVVSVGGKRYQMNYSNLPNHDKPMRENLVAIIANDPYFKQQLEQNNTIVINNQLTPQVLKYLNLPENTSILLRMERK